MGVDLVVGVGVDVDVDVDVDVGVDVGVDVLAQRPSVAAPPRIRLFLPQPWRRRARLSKAALHSLRQQQPVLHSLLHSLRQQVAVLHSLPRCPCAS